MGSVGSRRRRQCAVMGHPVNLAARLMQSAALGQIFVDGPTYQGVADSVPMEKVVGLKMKGLKPKDGDEVFGWGCG